MRCGILIIGSLLWDDSNQRPAWRAARLKMDSQVRVRGPFYYGRKSGEQRGHTFTMTFSAGEPSSQGIIVPCIAEISNIEGLIEEANALWKAEDANAKDGQIHKSWGCVGALFNPKAKDQKLAADWANHFRTVKAQGVSIVADDGRLGMAWPMTLDATPADFDVILATANKPDPDRPTASAVADAWIGQNGRHERYFFENVRHGIGTPDDAEIWRRIQERSPSWLKPGEYKEAIDILQAGASMSEVFDITKKYDAAYIEQGFTSLEALNSFALTFYKDVAEIYDGITRIKNVERNPTGFSLDDAPILGLLVRVWKLLKEVIRYYEENNAEIISILERPMLEGAVVASYLMTGDKSVIEDYRKCSYKDRLRLLRDLEEGSAFFETKAGKRLIKSVREKMAFENLTPQDFEVQKKNRWKIQGKTFRDIFAQMEHNDLYPATYGMMSESIHGSWNESMDYCLGKNEDGTFSAYPFSFPADIRFVTPTLRFTNKPYRLWLQRIDAYDDNMRNLLDWVERVNAALFRQFDLKYDG